MQTMDTMSVKDTKSRASGTTKHTSGTTRSISGKLVSADATHHIRGDGQQIVAVDVAVVILADLRMKRGQIASAAIA